MFLYHSSITGLPLDVIVQELYEAGCIVDWIEFAQDGLKGGWSFKRILERIDYALIDVFGIEYRDYVISKLTLIVEQ